MSDFPHDVGTPALRTKHQGAASTAVIGTLWRINRGSRPLVLPDFVARRADPKLGESLRDYWAVTETGDWERDVETGCAHARDATRFLRDERAPHILAWIAEEIVHKARFGPVEVGFFHEIGALI